ncbi:MAG: DNA translocase FtsK 4TM domain-containing protein, partial [Flavobacteriia bacterium]
MADNEYKPKEERSPEPEVKPTEKKAEKAKSGEKIKIKNPVEGLTGRFDKKKVKTTVGAMLILLSFYLFLSCLSYIFTCTEDQDRVLNKGLFEFLFDGSEEPVSNWLGKFGAWASHLLIYRWFGLSSFGFTVLLFISGVKILFNVTLFPIQKSYARVLLLAVWTSIFLGYFAGTVNYLGGSFGYYVNEWLALSLGRFGALVLIGVLGYIVTVILFNPNFRALLDRFTGSRGTETDDTDDNQLKSAGVNDLRVVNTIRDEEIERDNVAETITFDEDEEDEDEDFDESELIITVKQPEPEIDEEFEVEVPELEPNPAADLPEIDLDDLNTDDFSVDVAQSDEALNDDDLDKLRKEYGEYDPKLDLASYTLPPIDLLKDYGPGGVNVNKQELEDNKNKIVETLSHYKIDIAKIKATVGPTVTLYEIIPAPGVRISKIKNLEDDIALSLSALGIRIIAPIPGKGTIGIEVPNSKPEMVSMRSLIASEKFQNSD